MKRLHSIWAVLSVALLCVAGCERRVALDPQVNFQDEETAKVVAAIRAGGGAAAGGEESGAATGTGWGTLRGKFTFQGAAPAMEFISTGGKDADMCGDRVPNQSLIVDPMTNGIANVVVFARKVSRVKDAEAPTEPVVFDQKGCMFLTHVLKVRTGQPMKILNSDPKAHNTAISPSGDANINPQLPGGGETTVSFKRSQNAPVTATCSIHPWMKGFVFPRADGYVAVSAPDGTFEIKDLPAGENIEFMVWHEKVGGGAGGGLVAKSGWNGGRFKITIPADGVEDLGTIDVPASAFQ